MLHLHVFNCDVDSQADATQHDTQCYSGQYRHHDTWQKLRQIIIKQYDRIDAVRHREYDAKHARHISRAIDLLHWALCVIGCDVISYHVSAIIDQSLGVFVLRT